MTRKIVKSLLLFSIVLILGVGQTLASDGAILEPKIERYPEMIEVEIKEPPTWPVMYPSGKAALMADFDLSNIDLTDSLDLLDIAVFDTLTIWPDEMPDSFDPDQIIEWGKNPGIGLRELHQKGITGKDINVAILDDNLFLDHQEYKDNIKMYEEINVDFSFAQWHSAGVVSSFAGNTTGVAPDVNIYFISYNAYIEEDGETVRTWDPLTEAIQRIINVNQLLPEGQKIRVMTISNGWYPNQRGYQNLMNMIDLADQEGIFVISGNLFETHNMYYHGMDIDLYADRDDFSSFSVLSWQDWVSKIPTEENRPFYNNYFEKNIDPTPQFLLFPSNRVTMACSFATDNYVHYNRNGWSHMIPYIGGMYALACQVYPDITPETFWNEALATGIERIVEKDGKQYVGKIINPVKLMETLRKMAKQPIEG